MVWYTSKAGSVLGRRFYLIGLLIIALLSGNAAAGITLPGCGEAEAALSSNAATEGFPGKTCCCGGTGACTCDMKQESGNAPLDPVAFRSISHDDRILVISHGASVDVDTPILDTEPIRTTPERARAPSSALYLANLTFLI
jgi:hypothetical protein